MFYHIFLHNLVFFQNILYILSPKKVVFFYNYLCVECSETESLADIIIKYFQSYLLKLHKKQSIDAFSLAIFFV